MRPKGETALRLRVGCYLTLLLTVLSFFYYVTSQPFFSMQKVLFSTTRSTPLKQKINLDDNEEDGLASFEVEDEEQKRNEEESQQEMVDVQQQVLPTSSAVPLASPPSSHACISTSTSSPEVREIWGPSFGLEASSPLSSSLPFLPPSSTTVVNDVSQQQQQVVEGGDGDGTTEIQAKESATLTPWYSLGGQPAFGNVHTKRIIVAKRARSNSPSENVALLLKRLR